MHGSIRIAFMQVLRLCRRGIQFEGDVDVPCACLAVLRTSSKTMALEMRIIRRKQSGIDVGGGLLRSACSRANPVREIHAYVSSCLRRGPQPYKATCAGSPPGQYAPEKPVGPRTKGTTPGWICKTGGAARKRPRKRVRRWCTAVFPRRRPQ